MLKSLTFIALAAASWLPGDFPLVAPASHEVGAALASPMMGPDYWVGFGRDREMQYSRTSYAIQVAAKVGNAGSQGQQQQLLSLVVYQNGREVCSSSKAVPPPAPRRTVEPVAFQVLYTVPIESLPRVRMVSFNLVAIVTPAAANVASEDTNPANNRVDVELKFPAGGKPECIQLGE